jgi:hypothetical protein
VCRPFDALRQAWVMSIAQSCTGFHRIFMHTTLSHSPLIFRTCALVQALADVCGLRTAAPSPPLTVEARGVPRNPRTMAEIADVRVQPSTACHISSPRPLKERSTRNSGTCDKTQSGQRGKLQLMPALTLRLFALIQNKSLCASTTHTKAVRQAWRACTSPRRPLRMVA